MLKKQLSLLEIKRKRVNSLNYSTITFEEIFGKNHWHISSGNYQCRGHSDSLSLAEADAYRALDKIPDHGTVHCIYRNGKKVKPANANS